MKTIFILFLFIIPSFSFTCSLKSGSNTNLNQTGGTYPGSRYYGTLGVVENNPYLAFGFIDVLAGTHPDPYSDLWLYNTSATAFSWLSPNYGQVNQHQDQGSCLSFLPPVFPPNILGASSWVKDNLLWAFGGQTYIGFTNVLHYLSDLWYYDPSADSWTLYNSSAAGACDPNPYTTPGYPSARYGAASWVSNETLFLFGGKGQNGTLNDLWTFVNDTYWVNLENTYSPSARYFSTTWEDYQGNVWLYGGINSLNQTLSDMWQYNTTGYWNLICNSCAPGSREAAFSWRKHSHLLLYGGTLNTTEPQFWSFDLNALEWNIFNQTNTPNANGRIGGSSWKLNDGSIWLFGGKSTAGTHNDVWECVF
jgi:hypothetical protein